MEVVLGLRGVRRRRGRAVDFLLVDINAKRENIDMGQRRKIDPDGGMFICLELLYSSTINNALGHVITSRRVLDVS